ncbi:MAG: response regulator [Acidobacteriota bacterium]|nr:response regulator [Acidobacteriota bacterium]
MSFAVPILLVDDDAGQLRVREMILRNAGFHTIAVTSAERALELLAGESVKLAALVTDHMLPGLNGAQLVCELRRCLPHLPVIVLTGMPGVETEYEGLDVKIFTKPCDPEELIEMLRQLGE